MFQRIDSTLLAALALGAGLALPATGQEAQADGKAERTKSVLKALSEPLTIGDITIPESAVRRELTYSAGKTLIESRKMDIFIAEEIERQVAEGADRAKFLATDEEVQSKVATALERLQEEYPDHSPEEILGTRLIDRGALTGMVEQSELFDRVFLPEDPRTYPATTVEALQSQAGQEFVDKLIEGYVQRIEQGIEVNEADSGHLMWKNIMRQFVMKALNSNAVLETASDGIDPDVVMIVNGTEIATDAVFQELIDQGRLSPHEVNLTRMWLAKTTAVEAELREREAWIEDEEFADVWEKEEAPYRDSPFNLDVIAVGFRKFPSVDAYRRYFRLMKSYERLITEELTDEALQAHIDERAAAMLGLGKVKADVLWLSAFERSGARVKDDGWKEARIRADEAANALIGGKAWDDVLDEYSDFVDPPVPKSQAGQAPPSKERGRFPLYHRNELVQALGESDYWMFLSGYSVVDHVFFDQEVGKIDGPFEGVMGYYITKLIQRTPASKGLSLENEGQRDLVMQDYLTVRFNQFAHETLLKGEVSGIDLR